MSAMGSSAVVVVVPVVATMAQGTEPHARSARIASCERVGAHRLSLVDRDHPQVLAAEAREQGGLLDRAVTVHGGVDHQAPVAGLQAAAASEYAVLRSRAQSRATSVLVDAVSWMTPRKVSGRPNIWRVQSQTTSSSSVSAGLDCQESPSTPRPLLRKSPSTEAGEVLDGKYPKNDGCCQCDSPGRSTSSTSRITPSRDSGSTGGALGSGCAHVPGRRRGHHRQALDAGVIVGDPVDEHMTECGGTLRAS
jgi:hypothetical protein